MRTYVLIAVVAVGCAVVGAACSNDATTGGTATGARRRCGAAHDDGRGHLCEGRRLGDGRGVWRWDRRDAVRLGRQRLHGRHAARKRRVQRMRVDVLLRRSNRLRHAGRRRGEQWVREALLVRRWMLGGARRRRGTGRYGAGLLRRLQPDSRLQRHADHQRADRDRLSQQLVREHVPVRVVSRILSFAVLSSILAAASNASATTNQFRGVNWGDARDNFQTGVVYVSGLSSSDTYDSALATGTSVMTQFVSKLGANAVRMPINEATVSSYWSTYTGAIDAVLSKGSVVLCYWDSAKTNKPAGHERVLEHVEERWSTSTAETPTPTSKSSTNRTCTARTT